MGVSQTKNKERNKRNILPNYLVKNDSNRKCPDYSESDSANLKIKKYFTQNKKLDSNYFSSNSNSNSRDLIAMKKSKIIKKFKDNKRILNISHMLINNILGLKSTQENNLNFLKIFDIDSNLKKDSSDTSLEKDNKFSDSIFEFFSTKESNNNKKFLKYENNSVNISYLLNMLDSNSTLFSMSEKISDERVTKIEEKTIDKIQTQFEQKHSILSMPNHILESFPKPKIVSQASINLNPNIKTIKLSNIKRNNSNTNFNAKINISKENSNNITIKSPTKVIASVGSFQRADSKSPFKEKAITYSNDVRAKSPTNSSSNRQISSSKIQPNTKILKINLKKMQFSPIKITDEYICNTEVQDSSSPNGPSEQFIYAKKKVESQMNSKLRSDNSSKNSLNSKVISNICNSYHTENNSIFSNMESIQAYDILSLKERNYVNQSYNNSYLEIKKKKKEIEELNTNSSINMRNKSPTEKKITNTLYRDLVKNDLKSNRSIGNLKPISQESIKDRDISIRKFLLTEPKIDDVPEDENNSISVLNKYTEKTIDIPDEDLLTEDNFDNTINSCVTIKNKSNGISLHNSQCSKKSNKNLEKLNILKSLKTKIKNIEKEKVANYQEDYYIKNTEREIDYYDAITNSRKYLDIIAESNTNELEENEALNSNRYSNRVCQTPKFDSDGKRFSFNIMNGNKKVNNNYF